METGVAASSIGARGIRRRSILGAFLAAALLIGSAGFCQQPPRAADRASRFPLHAVGTRLIDARGQDFYVVGDAAWTLIVALDLDAAEQYLIAREAAGFNAILVELVEPRFSGPRNRSGQLPFPEGAEFNDYSEDYFAHAEAVLDLAFRHGFLVLLAPAYVGYRCSSEGYCQQMLRTPEETLERYGRFVGSRFAKFPNLIWVHGGDVDPAPYGAMSKVEAVYRGIAAESPNGLHTAHCSRNFSAIDCYDRPWLNVNTTYSDCDLTPEKIELDRRRVQSMPTIYIEGRYEEEASTPACIRAQLWWTYLGGLAGHVFGNKRIWTFADDWRDALTSPGAQEMTLASRFVQWLAGSGQDLRPTGLDAVPLEANRFGTAWERLFEPNYPRSLVWQAFRSPSAGVAAATVGTSKIVYLPHTVSLNYAGNDGTLCWLSPRSGEISPAAGDLSPPEPSDWLLVVEETADLCSRTSL